MGNGAHLLVRQLGPLPDAGAGFRASTCSEEDRGGLRGWGLGGSRGGDGLGDREIEQRRGLAGWVRKNLGGSRGRCIGLVAAEGFGGWDSSPRF